MPRNPFPWLLLTAIALLLWVARGILPPFIVAGAFAYLLYPVAVALDQRTRLSRRAATGVVLVAVLGALALAIWLVGARLTAEARTLALQGPDLALTVIQQLLGDQPLVLFGLSVEPRQLAAQINSSIDETIGGPTQALHAAQAAIEVTLNVLLMVLALIYFSLDGARLGDYLLRFVPAENRQRVASLAGEVHLVLGRYLRGQAILAVLMSAVTFLVLEFVFRLPYALPIAVLTGVLDLVPVLGPVVAGLVACAVALQHFGLPTAGWVALAYFILRQVEDQLIMPMVVGRAVHLHPLVPIFAVLVGERVGGVLGMLLAIPAAAALKIIVEAIYDQRALEAEAAAAAH